MKKKRKNYSVYGVWTDELTQPQYVVAKTEKEAKRFFARISGIPEEEIHALKYSLKELCGSMNDNGKMEVKSFQQILGDDYEYTGPEFMIWR